MAREAEQTDPQANGRSRLATARANELGPWEPAVRDAERLRQVRALELLDTDAEPEFDRITRVASRILGTPIALLSLIDDQRQFNKSVHGATGLENVPLEGAFCRHVVAAKAALAVPDAAEHHVLRSLLGDNPLGIQSYAGVPVAVDGGVVVGVLCVLGRTPRTFTDEELELLEDLAGLAADEIKLRRAGDAVTLHRNLLHAVVNGMREGVLVASPSGEVLLHNRAYLEQLGEAAAASLARIDATGLFAADGITALRVEQTPLGQVLAGADAVEADVVYRAPGAARGRKFRASATSLRRDGTLLAGILVQRDVTEERALLHSHEERRVLLETVLAHMPDTAVLVFDRELRCLIAETGASATPVFRPEDFRGRPMSEIVAPNNREVVLRACEEAFRGQQTRLSLVREERSFDVRVIPLRQRNGELFAGVVLSYDVTERVRADELLAKHAEELRSLSLSDELTGLRNRRGFITLAEQQLKHALRSQRGCALLYVDVNDLKPVNDRLGHEAGDQLLRDVADLLRSTFRDSDITARVGGDEFAVLVLDLAAADLEPLEERLHAAAAGLVQARRRPYRISVSVGAALVDSVEGSSLEQLMTRADAQMYERKRAYKRAAR